jgi:predicted nuclease of predicted toxin-antitoxin system
MKILVDMNLSPDWAKYLSNAGIEAEHWSLIGPVDAPDREIMSFAANNEYVVLTQDLDFSAILAATHRSKPSVVQIRSENLSLDSIGQSVTAAVLQLQTDLEAGALLTIDQAKRVRLRLLPFHFEE